MNGPQSIFAAIRVPCTTGEEEHMPLFAGHELSCIRGDRTVFTALNFTLPAGEALVLTGPNGSGKSSLLRLMAGLLKAAAGGLTWAGTDIAADLETHRVRLHYVGHLDAVKPVLTVRENLAFWAGFDARGDVGNALEHFGLARLAGSPARFLSAGQRRRLALARLLAAERSLWLLDEPSVALDRTAIAALESVIATHRANGGMVAVATHTEIALAGAHTVELDHYAPPAPEIA